jgi:hypothetical protein
MRTLPNLARPPQSDDSAIKARIDTLRAVIQSIPQDQRAAVFAQARDLLPAELFEKTKVPHRGGDVLNNVFELFKADPALELKAANVLEALAKAGKPAEAQPVRAALNYLNSRRILHRVSYGLYRLENGDLVESPLWG